MTAEYVRDAIGTAAVLGFFAMSWFGWAQEKPPASWLWPLRIGTILSGLTAIAGGLLLWHHWSDGSVIDAEVGPRFGIVVGIEIALAGFGAWFLAARTKQHLIPAWIAFVVGVHFFPLAVLLQIPALHVTAALVTAASIASVWVARARGLTVSAVAGATTGPILLGSALVALADALTR